MAGNLTFDALKAAVADGSIDTVVVAMTDMAGQLIGKRFHARHFVESAYEETHGCNYLLANDIDMEPVPGYAAASWSQGYGDFVLKPDLATLRVIPWLPATALVLADVARSPPSQCPALTARHPQEQVRPSLERMKMKGLFRLRARVLPVQNESYGDIHARGYREPKTAGYYIEDYHVFQRPRKSLSCGLPQRLQGAGIPVENSKASGAPARGNQRPLRRCAEMAEPHVIIKNGIKRSPTPPARPSPTWPSGATTSPDPASHVHASLWDAAGRKPLFFDP